MEAGGDIEMKDAPADEDLLKGRMGGLVIERTRGASDPYGEVLDD